MLVLTRKEGEEVLLGDKDKGFKIRVFVVEIRGDKVRLGIEAPPDVKVFRGEVLPKYLSQV